MLKRLSPGNKMRLIATVGLVSSALAAHADWPQIFDTGTSLTAQSIAVDGSGNVYVAGSTFTTLHEQVLVIKYDKLGELKWSKALNLTSSSSDHAAQIVLDSLGNPVIGGTSRVNRDPSKFLAIKLNPAGGVLWKKGLTSSGLYDHVARALALDANDNVLLTGASGYGKVGFVTIKANANGEKLWSRNLNGSGSPDEEAVRVGTDAAGNAYVFGNLYRDQGWYTAIVKYSSAGDELWVKKNYGLPNSDPYRKLAGDLAVAPTGGLAVIEARYESEQFGFWVETNRYDDQANLIWQSHAGAGSKTIVEFPGELLVDGNDNVYVTLIMFNELVAIKYGPTGETLWADFYLSKQPKEYLSIAGIGLDSDSNFYVAGTCRGPNNATTRDYLTIKYDPMGFRKFVKKFDSANGANDVATAAVVDSTRGRIYITGTNDANSILTIRN